MATKKKVHADTLTLAEVIEIMDPVATPDNKKRNSAFKKRMNDWEKRGWIKKYGRNAYSGRSVITALIRKKGEGIQSKNEKVGIDTELSQLKALKIKYQADFEEAKADIFDRVKFRGEHIHAYFSDLLASFRTELEKFVYSLPATAVGTDVEELQKYLEDSYRRAFQKFYDRLDYDKIIKYVDHCEGDRE